MKCPHCGGEIDQKAQNDLRKPSVPQCDMGGQSQARLPGFENNGKNRRPRTGKSAIDPDWKPTPDLEAYAKERGIDDLPWAVETFRLHYQASGAKWLRWDMVWMKACRDGWLKPKERPQNGPYRGKQEAAVLPPVEPWPQRLAAFKSTGFWLPNIWGPPPGAPGCRAPK